MYIPSRRDELLRHFNIMVLKELQRFRWKVYNETLLAGRFAETLDIAAKALEEQSAEYELWLSGPQGRGPHVSAADRGCMYLAAIFGRLDIIDKYISFEQLGLAEAKRPYQPLGFAVDSHRGIETDDQLRIRHEHNNAAAAEVHTERLQQAQEHRADHARFKALLKAVKRQPGVLQVDLKSAVPGKDTKAVTRMIDQLEAAGLVATKKVGSRVAVWAADAPGVPPASERREQRWAWAWDIDAYLEEPSHEEEDPARTVANIEQLAATINGAAREPATDESLQPTPLDFLNFPSILSPAKSEGIPVYYDPEELAMAVWGHHDLAESAVLAQRIIEGGGYDTTTNQKKKWLRASPRHTHVERIAFVGKYLNHGRPGWLLKEVTEPTWNSVPVTAFTAASACTDPDKAPDLEVACWVKQKPMRAAKPATA